MASHKTTEELPVIWLAPPAALLPSTHTNAIHTIPIAASATLTSLIVLVLIVLYNKKPKVHAADELTTLKDGIRIVHSEHTFPRCSPTNLRSCYSPPHERITATNDDSSSIPSSRDAYHDYLKDNLHALSYSHQSPTAPQSPSEDSYTIPSYYENGGSSNCSVNSAAVNALDANPVITAASSDYSVSIGPTPVPSRQNSIRGGDADGVWTRLRLGSDYDGDRTFVPTEANLQLGSGKGEAGQT